MLTLTSQNFKRTNKYYISSPVYLFLWLMGVATGAAALFWQQYSTQERKKLQRMKQKSNFPRGSFSNKENTSVPFQFRKKAHPIIFQYPFLSIWSIRSISCSYQCTNSIYRAKWINSTFWNNEISKLLPNPVKEKS